ncbi:hypothetical protein HR45_14660 [Shewanella mangrovi]|uniref:PTS sugar transporter subunit IIA n=1 Tax=Shewanella mangrovi TaxID=1515746 RepID=A0A094J9V1_9GAMM|nr:DUF3389 family protein [Shewanella mangrovi]KFZ36700.1 hypothetical protein HR45_14660 [Shewanella mangrovi]
MLLTLNHAKLILSPQELQVRLMPSGAILSVLLDDLRLIASVNLLVANVGAVSWQLPLDNAEQLQQIADFYGIAAEAR